MTLPYAILYNYKMRNNTQKPTIETHTNGHLLKQATHTTKHRNILAVRSQIPQLVEEQDISGIRVNF